MAIASERTVWAEGMGFSEETVELLTLIVEESDRRCRVSEHPDCRPNLATSDLGEWFLELCAYGFDDLATRVCEIRDELPTVESLAVEAAEFDQDECDEPCTAQELREAAVDAWNALRKSIHTAVIENARDKFVTAYTAARS